MPTRPQPDQPLDWSALAERLRRCALALVGRRRAELADDLVQDTLAKFVARDGRPPSYAYARAALVRRYLDHERAAGRRAARAVRWALSRPSPVSRAKGDSPIADGPQIQAALDRLSPTQRAALALRLVEELPTEAVAEAIGCTPRVVRSSLHAARSRMRQMLGHGDRS